MRALPAVVFGIVAAVGISVSFAEDRLCLVDSNSNIQEIQELPSHSPSPCSKDTVWYCSQESTGVFSLIAPAASASLNEDGFCVYGPSHSLAGAHLGKTTEGPESLHTSCNSEPSTVSSVAPVKARASVPVKQAVLTPIPTPTSVKVLPDERVARLEWDMPQVPSVGSGNGSDQSYGFKVTWGPVANPTQNTSFTHLRRMDLQPLIAGQQYVASVRYVTSEGRASAAISSSPSTFSSNSSRVDAMRVRLNGFFDDFNQAAGTFDELKWNTAYSACNSASYDFSFINLQFHAHNLIKSGYCDRSQVSNRARAPLIFTPESPWREIAFDFDKGGGPRDAAYIDILPDLTAGNVGPDLTSVNQMTTLDGHIPHAMRLAIHHDRGAEFYVSNGDGVSQQVALRVNNFNSGGSARIEDWAINNRVHARLFINMDLGQVRLLINESLAFDSGAGAFSLPRRRYNVAWTVFSYNTTKMTNNFMSLLHWDNFGFDAPAGYRPQYTIYNYKLNNSGTDQIASNRSTNSRPMVTLQIPDDISSSVNQRLYFTLQGDTCRLAPGDFVTVNGTRISLPSFSYGTTTPRSFYVSGSACGGRLMPAPVFISVPKGAFKRGSNTIEFSLEAVDIIKNIHAEFDMVPGTGASFTQPHLYAAGPGLPADFPVGPNILARFRIGGTDIPQWNDTYSYPSILQPAGSGHSQEAPLVVSGKPYIDIRWHSGSAMQVTGKTPGLAWFSVALRGIPLIQHRADAEAPAAGGVKSFLFDTTKHPDGIYQLQIQGTGSQGEGLLLEDWREFSEGVPGNIPPYLIRIDNGSHATTVWPNQGTPPTPTASAPLPTTTPTIGSTPRPTVTATSTIGVTPRTTATPTPTPIVNTGTGGYRLSQVSLICGKRPKLSVTLAGTGLRIRGRLIRFQILNDQVVVTRASASTNRSGVASIGVSTARLKALSTTELKVRAAYEFSRKKYIYSMPVSVSCSNGQ